jgi:hypothetical protein
MDLKQWAHDKLWSAPEDRMGCPTWEFPNIPQATYDKLLAEAAAAGVEIDGETAKAHGCTFSWVYDPAAELVRITCQSKPFLFGCGEILAHFTAIIEQATKGNL